MTPSSSHLKASVSECVLCVCVSATHRGGASLDHDAGCGGPQGAAGSVVVPEADLGLGWGRHTHSNDQPIH